MAATEHETRLTLCNRKLLEDLQRARQRLALADEIVRMLGECCGDWQEARATISRYHAAEQT